MFKCDSGYRKDVPVKFELGLGRLNEKGPELLQAPAHVFLVVTTVDDSTAGQLQDQAASLALT